MRILDYGPAWAFMIVVAIVAIVVVGLRHDGEES